MRRAFALLAAAAGVLVLSAAAPASAAVRPDPIQIVQPEVEGVDFLAGDELVAFSRFLGIVGLGVPPGVAVIAVPTLAEVTAGLVAVGPHMVPIVALDANGGFAGQAELPADILIVFLHWLDGERSR